jgi:putative transposase
MIPGDSDEEITILRNADRRDSERSETGRAVKEICRKHGISEATYYNWKSKYGGLEASDLKRLRELEGELSQYKRMYAELARENDALKDLIHRKL